MDDSGYTPIVFSYNGSIIEGRTERQILPYVEDVGQFKRGFLLSVCCEFRSVFRERLGAMPDYS
jgi:hypothetical protein